MHPDDTAHSDTAILIKNSIRYNNAEKYRQDFLQATTIIVKDCTSLIIILYPPHAALPNIKSLVNNLSHSLKLWGTDL